MARIRNVDKSLGQPGEPGEPGELGKPEGIGGAGGAGGRGGHGGEAKKDIHYKRWFALTVWIIIFTVVVGILLQKNNQLSTQNQRRIKENAQIQKSLTNLSVKRSDRQTRIICHEQNIVKAALRHLYRFELDEKKHSPTPQRDELLLGLQALQPTKCV